MRSVSEISAEINKHRDEYKVRANALDAELANAQKAIRFECDACHRAVKVGAAKVIQWLEFRCPGQTGGYFVNSSRSIKCPHCGGLTNDYNQPEIRNLSNNLFASVEEKDESCR